MTLSVRAKLFVTQMRRGRLHARSCRHDQHVDGPYRPSGRNASPSGITQSPIMSPTQSHPGSWTEIRLSASAHTIRLLDRAHAPPPGPVVSTTSRPRRLRRNLFTDKERGTAPTEVCPPEIRFSGNFN
jgi:hypothetical protein